MSMCMNSRCNGTDFLCGKCKKLYPSLAASLAEKKRSRNNNGNSGRRIAGAVISGAMTITGATTSLPQSGYAPLQDEAKSSVQNERSRQGRDQRGETRNRGNRTGGSGRGY